MTEVKFIHAADLHLDSPFVGMGKVSEHIFQDIYTSTFESYDRLIEEAILREVDFVLLVGDIFDRVDRSLHAQIHLRNGFERLHEQGIQVYMSHGNHDYIKSTSYHVEYPPNVHVFQSEEVGSYTYQKRGKPIACLYGFSYESEKVIRNKTSEFFIEDENIPFHIALLHGTVHGNHEHDRYAPFRLTDLLRKSHDYWALGHIHQRTVLSKVPYVVYPGNIQGRHRKEVGEKGFYEVTMNELETKLSFVPVHTIEFVDVTIYIHRNENISSIERKIYNELNQVQSDIRQLVYITFQVESELENRFSFEARLEELIDIMNETLAAESNWTYIYRTKIKTRAPKPMNELGQDTFTKELFTKLANSPIEQYIDTSIQHTVLRKVIHDMIENEEESIKKIAIDYFTDRLFK